MILPRNDLVLIERIEEPQTGLIYIPDVAKEKSMKGRVLAVGPGKYVEGVNGNQVRRPVEAKVGEIWYFNSKWSDLSPTHYVDDQISDRKLHLVMEADLLLKVTNGANGTEVHRGRIAAGSNAGNGKVDKGRSTIEARHSAGTRRHAAISI